MYYNISRTQLQLLFTLVMIFQLYYVLFQFLRIIGIVVYYAEMNNKI